MKYPRLLSSSALSVISVILVFLLVESGLRAGIVKTRIYERLQPVGAANAQLKMVILGDSFIYKDGLLDHMLSSQLNIGRFQILNLATPGSGPQEYRSELKIFGMNYKPNIILLSYYAGNDLSNVKSKMTFEVGLRAGLRPFWRSLYLYHLFNDAWMFWAKTHSYNYTWAGQAHLTPNSFNENLLIENTETVDAWNKTKSILKDVIGMSESIKAKLIIVIFPESLQVSRFNEKFYKKSGFNIDPRVFDSTRPQDLLMGFCREQKIDCLDLLPSFRQAAAELYLQNDIHLAEAGNLLAAEKISEFVTGRMR